MRTSIYLEQDMLRVLCGETEGGSFKAAAWRSRALPEGAVGTDGRVLDAKAVAEVLRALKEGLGREAKPAELVVDGSGILVKTIRLPDIERAKLEKLVRSEFQNMAEGREELLCDYAPMPESGKAGYNALCVAAERPLIAGCEEAFKRAGWKLRSVDVAASCFLRLAALPPMKGESGILAVIGSSSISTGLYLDGRFNFYNRAQLSAAAGTPERRSEVTRILSQLLQFSASSGMQTPPQQVWLAGSGSEGDEMLLDYVADALSVNAARLESSEGISAVSKGPGAFDLAEYVCCVGNILEAGEK